MARAVFFIGVLLFLLVFVGCTKEITQEQASLIAKTYVESAVKPYTSQNGSIININKPDAVIKEVYRMDKNYIAIVHISATVDSVVKKKGLTLVIDAKSGKIIDRKEFSIKD